MTEKFYDEQIEGLIVNSVTGPHIDNTDPKNPILPEFVLKAVYDLAMINKADIDGGGTTGGVWYQDTILSDLFPNYKQVIRVLGGQMAIEYGNVELDVHRFVVTSVSGLKVKVGNAEYTVFHNGNFNPDSKANTDGSNATGALATTIANNHNHTNKSVIDSVTAQDLIDWDDASAQSHNALTLGSNAVGIDLNTATQRLQFQNGYQLPTTIKLGEYDEAFLMRHSHGNKLVLDNLTQAVIDNSHTHGNKALLDSYNQTNANIADAVNLRHSHINKAILDAITAAYTTADKHTLDALAGIQLEADQANALIRIKDGNGNVLSTLNVAFLNNEGTQFVYNPSNNTLDLINDYGQILSSIPVSSFVTNLVSNANWNGTTPSRLDFKDNAGTILFSIDYAIANIQGLQTALDGKANVNGNNITNIIDWRNVLDIYSTAQVNGLLAGKHTVNNGQFSGNVNSLFNTTTKLFNATGAKHAYGAFVRFADLDSGSQTYNFAFNANSVRNGSLSVQVSDDSGAGDWFDIWTQGNFDPNTKANTSGYYSGLSVGNADNATEWNNEQFDGTNPATTASYFMISNGGGIWNYISNSDVRNSLGINTAWNLQQVTTNGNSTTNPIILSGILPSLNFKGTQANAKEFQFVSSYYDVESMTLRNVTDNLLLMHFKSNGSIGIGTDNPQAILHVNGNAIVANATASNHAVAFGQLGNYALTNGSNTVGGTWDIQKINSSALGNVSGNGQVFNVSGNVIYWGNPLLNYQRFEMATNNSLVVYSAQAGTEGEIWHSFNFNPANYALLSQVYTQSQVNTLLNDKVDKVAGKQLSTEDYTSAEKTKLAGIQAGAEVNVNADWNATSGDAQILNKPTIPNAPNNGTFTVQGDGVDIIGSGSTSADASVNTSSTLSLSAAVKSDIEQGIEANLVIPSVIDGVDFFNISSISPQTIAIQKKKTIINVSNAVIGFDIEVTDGLYDGYSLAINGGAEWSGFIKGSFRISDGSTGNFNHSGDTSGSLLFWWVASMGQWVQAT